MKVILQDSIKIANKFLRLTNASIYSLNISITCFSDSHSHSHTSVTTVSSNIST